MIITLVVDGYNAINCISEIKKELKKDLLCARRAVLAVCREYARSSGYINEVKVVFDGQDKYRELNRVYLRGKDQVFSKTDKGDDKVIETVKKCMSKGRVVLASNDNYVRNNARAYGATPIRVEELVSKKGKVKSEKSEGKFHGIGSEKLAEITKEYRDHLGI